MTFHVNAKTFASLAEACDYAARLHAGRGYAVRVYSHSGTQGDLCQLEHEFKA